MCVVVVVVGGVVSIFESGLSSINKHSQVSKRRLSPVCSHTSHMDKKVSSVDSPSVMSRVTEPDSLSFPTPV